MAIEIEKKFLLNDVQQRLLLEDAVELGRKQVSDSYFDAPDFRLTRGDFWLRLRDGKYELKAPLTSTNDGNTGTNRYHEITDHSEITRLLDISTETSLEEALASADMTPFVTCYTDRRSYEKDGFHIDLDEATYKNSSFTYAIAEIELLIDSEAEADQADERIMTYAASLGLTTTAVILGKIGAFIQTELPQHYSVLVKAGVFK